MDVMRSKDQPALLGFPDLWGLLGTRLLSEQSVPLDLKGEGDPREDRVLMVFQGQWDPQECKVFQDHREHLEQGELLEILDHLVCQDPPGLEGKQD